MRKAQSWNAVIGTRVGEITNRAAILSRIAADPPSRPGRVETHTHMATHIQQWLVGNSGERLLSGKDARLPWRRPSPASLQNSEKAALLRPAG